MCFNIFKIKILSLSKELSLYALYRIIYALLKRKKNSNFYKFCFDYSVVPNHVINEKVQANN